MLIKLQHVIRDKRSAKNQHVRLLKDNAGEHVSRLVPEKLKGYGWEVLEDPPYSSNLTPSDFHLFRSTKTIYGGKKFNSDHEFKRTVLRWALLAAAESP